MEKQWIEIYSVGDARRIATPVGRSATAIASGRGILTAKVSATTTTLATIAMIQEGRATVGRGTGSLGGMITEEGKMLGAKITNGGMRIGGLRGDLRKRVLHTSRKKIFSTSLCAINILEGAMAGMIVGEA